MQILKVIAPVSLQNKFCKYTSQTHWSLAVILKDDITTNKTTDRNDQDRNFITFATLLYKDILKKNRNINFTGLFLLLLYLFSNSPANLFHHHDYNIVAYDKADKCEKAIYYANKDGSCNHKHHITKSFEKCSLCDNHTVSVHTVFYPIFVCVNVIATTEHHPYNVSFYSLSTSETSNRGPPTV